MSFNCAFLLVGARMTVLKSLSDDTLMHSETHFPHCFHLFLLDCFLCLMVVFAFEITIVISASLPFLLG